MTEKRVEIVVTNTIVGNYEARSYPSDQIDKDGYYPLYRVPVFKIIVTGIDTSGSKKAYEFMAPRFMPYFNDPLKPKPHYRTKGWVNSGLSAQRTIVVTRYNQSYEVQNRYSPGKGAIVIQDTFYIHAGPASLLEYGFGSAGCIEIIGNYDNFKNAIAELSGVSKTTSDNSIDRLVKARKLIVSIQAAAAPDIKSAYIRKVLNWNFK